MREELTGHRPARAGADRAWAGRAWAGRAWAGRAWAGRALLALFSVWGCASASGPVEPIRPLDFYVTVDPAAVRLEDDTVDAVSFVAPPAYLDACPSTPTPLPPAQPSARLRARTIAESTLRWPRKVCRCLLRARGASPFLRGPEVVSFALEVAGSARPRAPSALRFEGESRSEPCLRDYLEARPVAAGPGPLVLRFKIEIHESYETRRLHDVLQTVRLDFAQCFADAPRPRAPVELAWSVGEDGRARDIVIPPSSKTATCIESILSRLTFQTCTGCLARFEVHPP